MVSSPVSDLIAPMYIDRYIEYKNSAGDILRFKTFAKDGVKMVSLNGIEIGLDELFDIIQDVDGADNLEVEENECHIILPCMLGIATAFIIIILYMRYVFSVAFS
jgi:hypothetical protein